MRALGKCNAMHSGKFKQQQNDNYLLKASGHARQNCKIV